ncbi:MAG: hypothetical protein UR69_C0003G0065 [Candidatus Moranbacteria bacterium GW2011_GWE2_35_2-]|nr:MAG: hypothetical protein UR69_C0003G0065 [Candidatus Moranbacteria bacterium GW2011_GWE2_35_2-]KKQ05487.1 MAG: hypothetical protein US15_C0029G0004 [Candidatus Moranbacteria bacterium GW2011_GWF1_36_4]KKQ22083.1 MAG: hypothetical protein US37_C0004G0042 [Candidatus Moranbacteria bacterium GW2011_GWF2_37_11]KKQ29164.1 MAG: hypothetical protein US44_C0003G0076 [Candidatus Moranbacteria bacterium GW2011_GWD1_37_17]KKQ31149.1 MAG: hypothetical protein US47_C0001G0382 [Candidatus Moranbacteria b
MKKNKVIKLYIFFLIIFGIFSDSYAQASEVFIESEGYFEKEEKMYEIAVFIDNEGKNINALEGEMFFMNDDFDFQKIIDGGSIINFWIENPRKVSDGKIIFSGGIPGGYNGNKGFLFSVVFSASKNVIMNDTAEISLQNLRVYLNDGKGTMENLNDFKVVIKLNEINLKEKVIDEKPPEIFAPYITRDPNLSDEQWIVIMSAQDKGDGVDYYEVYESEKKHDMEEIINDNSIPWKTVEDKNIYILQDQKLGSYIYVKAVDKAGNARVVFATPAISEKKQLFNYKVILGIIMVVIIGIALLFEFFVFRERKIK